MFDTFASRLEGKKPVKLAKKKDILDGNTTKKASNDRL